MSFEAKEPIPYVARWTDPRTHEQKVEEGTLKVGESASEVLDRIKIREHL